VLTVAAPPRGTVWHGGRAITGRLYGPATFPQALWALRRVAELTGDALALIGCGGVHSAENAQAMLNAGAVAVQVDSYIWKDPRGFAQLARIWNRTQISARLSMKTGVTKPKNQCLSV
jgi:dihydroorotate dehydrogenase